MPQSNRAKNRAKKSIERAWYNVGRIFGGQFGLSFEQFHKALSSVDQHVIEKPKKKRGFVLRATR